jgi:hypothetical protein
MAAATPLATALMTAMAVSAMAPVSLWIKS